MRGLQVSLKLCNVCAYQDRIFVVLFGNMPAAPAGTHLYFVIMPATTLLCVKI